MTVLARITSAKDGMVEAKAYFIGDLYFDYDRQPAHDSFGTAWANKLEVPVSLVDSFKEVQTIPRATAGERARLAEIPERDVKQALAEIIGEPYVPKDWGGEAADLLSPRVLLDGNRVNTAFVLKGPGHFKPLSPAGLGKNGDQLVRAFNEPVEFVVLQHCHSVQNAVRQIMRGLAANFGGMKRFCIIDGEDTARLLKAYVKLGFAPT